MRVAYIAEAVVLLATIGLCFGATAQASTRHDQVDENYLTGYLTWNDGKGAISWSQPQSLDPGTSTGIPRQEFVSDALPRTLHVNGSRLIQLDLFMKDGNERQDGSGICNAGSNLDPILWMGERIVGGTTDRASFDPNTFPLAPNGYCIARDRFQAEVAVLEAGSRLTLVLEDSSASVYGIGMGGDHWSVIRIPFFPEEELPFRYPSYAHGGPGTPLPTGALADLLGRAGLAGVSIAIAGRRTRGGLAGLVLAIIVLGALAGCTSKPASPTAHDAPIATRALDPVYQDDRNLSGEGLGSLIGHVKSTDADRPVEGAYVALLGTNRSQITDRYGRFSFHDLAPRAYVLRIDRTGFHSFEGTVDVRRDLIAQVNATLVRIGVSDAPGERPHLHDYWGTQTEITLLDRHPLGLAGCDVPGALNCNPVGSFVIPPPAEGEIHSILPGTYDVNVTVDWDPERYHYDSFGLGFQANNDADLENWTWMAQRPRAQSFHIVTAWGMEDPGHQRFSTWAFSIGGGFAKSTAPDPVTQALWNNERHHTQPSFIVTVKIRKGVVPLEPAHPERWAGRNAVVVAGPGDRDAAGEFSSSTTAYRPYDVTWLPSAVVPQGTRWLDVWVNASRPFLADHDIEFRYRSAVSPPSGPCWARGGAECSGEEYQVRDPDIVQGTSRRWIVPVRAEDADPFYTIRSFWVFGIRPAPDPASEALSAADDFAGGDLRLTLTAVAHRDAPPAT